MNVIGWSPTIQPHTETGAGTMTYDEQRHEIDAETIILGLGYVTGLLVLIAWVALSFF